MEPFGVTAVKQIKYFLHNKVAFSIIKYSIFLYYLHELKTLHITKDCLGMIWFTVFQIQR